MDNLGKGIQSLIPKKSVVSQPPIEKGDDIDNSDEALEKQISQKIDKLIAPLSELNQDLKKEIKPQESEFHDDLNFKPRVKGDKKMDKIFYLEADKIKSNPEQPRHHFSESSIDELADSIRGYGILEPLIVYRHELESSTGTQVEYYLIAGERRLLAAKKLGLETVPAIIRETDSEKEKLELALTENIQREDLPLISEAKAFARLIEEFGLSQKEVGERLGKSREVVANTLRLLQLPYEAQKALDEAKINEGHARAILMLTNPQKRLALLGEILSKGLSGREAEDLSRRYMGLNEVRVNNPRKQSFSLDPNDLELKEKLESIFQTPVVIKKKGNQGEISVKFYSEEELGKITQLMLGQKKENQNNNI